MRTNLGLGPVMGREGKLEHCSFISAGINLSNFGWKTGRNVVFTQRVSFSIV